MIKNILVITKTYLSQDGVRGMGFVHSRNKEYVKKGVNVDVLCFSAKKPYLYEGINVFPKNQIKEIKSYDVVLSHSPNILDHCIFVFKNLASIKKIVVFFHGREILYINKYYPKNYSWQKEKSVFEMWFQQAYDYVKFFVIKKMLQKEKVKFIFVSEWMKKEGSKCLKLDEKTLNKCSVINNVINDVFYQTHYSFSEEESLGDFVTIRALLDGRKYAVDKVVELALNNPNFTFHIYGNGDFFDYNIKPSNVLVHNGFIEQKDIPNLLNKYRGAIMPTLLDAQGVMMCEMASYGIPILVSDLPVCREMLDGFPNCTFIENNSFKTTNLDTINLSPLEDFSVVEKFSPKYLIEKELSFFEMPNKKTK